ncbi:hypothetical protein ACIG87_20335 [Micromonospora sp. NPDC051925]
MELRRAGNLLIDLGVPRDGGGCGGGVEGGATGDRDMEQEKDGEQWSEGD